MEEIFRPAEPKRYNPENSGYTQPITSDHPSSGKKYVVYALSVIIIVALIAVFVFMVHGPSHNTSSTTIPNTYTTVPAKNTGAINMATVQSFFKEYGITLPIVEYSSGGNMTNQGVCDYSYYIKGYHQSGVLSANAINYSIFNKSEPLLVTLSISVINQSNVDSFSSTFYNNSGNCNSYMDPIISNSTSNLSINNFSNLTLYTWKLSNFTSDGLNLTYTYYTGNAPDLYWYFSKALYMNTKIEVSVWGFNGYQNSTFVTQQMHSLVSAFINATQNNS